MIKCGCGLKESFFYHRRPVTICLIRHSSSNTYSTSAHVHRRPTEERTDETQAIFCGEHLIAVLGVRFEQHENEVRHCTGTTETGELNLIPDAIYAISIKTAMCKFSYQKTF
jgi:hypothetical protein